MQEKEQDDLNPTSAFLLKIIGGLQKACASLTDRMMISPVSR